MLSLDRRSGWKTIEAYLPTNSDCRTLLQRRDIGAMLVFVYISVVLWHLGSPRLIQDTYYRMLIPSLEVARLLTGGSADLAKIFAGDIDLVGSQFFMYPVFELLGWMPRTIRITQVVVTAGAASIMFLGLRRKFDALTASTLVLMLSTMALFLQGRDVDLHFLYFFSALFLYLYIGWHEHFNTASLAGMGIVAGMGLYVKGSSLFPVMSLFLATILVERERIKTYITVKTIATGFFSFLAGSVFFWGPRLAGIVPPDPGFVPRVYGPEMLPRYAGAISHLITPLNLTYDPNIGTYLYLALLASGIFISFKHRRDMVYATATIIGLIVPLYAGIELGSRHFAGMYPLLLVVLGQNVVPLTTWRLGGLTRRVIPIILLLATVAVLLPPTPATSVQFTYFSQTEYDHITALNTTAPLATNQRTAYLSARFRKGSETVFLTPLSGGGTWQPDKTVDLEEAARRYGTGRLALLLKDTDTCPGKFPSGEDRYACGYDTETVLERLSVNTSRITPVDFGVNQYLFVPAKIT